MGRYATRGRLPAVLRHLGRRPAPAPGAHGRPVGGAGEPARPAGPGGLSGVRDPHPSPWSRRRLPAHGGRAARRGHRRRGRGTAGSWPPPRPPARGSDARRAGRRAPGIVPFDGEHQAGIERPTISQAGDAHGRVRRRGPRPRRARRVLRELTVRARALSEARPPEPRDAAYPPAESGILGSSIGPADLTVTVSVGRVPVRRSLRPGGAPTARARRRCPRSPTTSSTAAETHGDLMLTCAPRMRRPASTRSAT